jgi:hypothetical protein
VAAPSSQVRVTAVARQMPVASARRFQMQGAHPHAWPAVLRAAAPIIIVFDCPIELNYK